MMSLTPATLDSTCGQQAAAKAGSRQRLVSGAQEGASCWTAGHQDGNGWRKPQALAPAEFGATPQRHWAACHHQRSSTRAPPALTFVVVASSTSTDQAPGPEASRTDPSISSCIQAGSSGSSGCSNRRRAQAAARLRRLQPAAAAGGGGGEPYPSARTPAGSADPSAKLPAACSPAAGCAWPPPGAWAAPNSPFWAPRWLGGCWLSQGLAAGM